MSAVRLFVHPLPAVALGLTALAACTDDIGAPELGAAELTILSVPQTVQCIHVDATGASGVVSTSLSVVGGDAPVTLALGALPTGWVQLAGTAYDAPCPDPINAPPDEPSWIALPITAQLIPGVPRPLAFEFRRNLPGSGTADFQETAVSIAQGDTVTLALMADGTLRGWGKSYFGELGLGTQVIAKAVPTPVAAELRELIGVASTMWRSCAWDETQLWCWGANFGGAIGDGTTTMRVSPTLVPGPWTRIADVQMSFKATCLLDQDRRTFCWGSNTGGGLGLPTTTPDMPQPYLLPRRYEAIALGASFTCGLNAGGSVECWGTNSSGQLGTPPTVLTQSSTPLAVGVRAIVDVAAGYGHVCAVRADGTVWCWGTNNAGQLGNGTTVPSSSPVQVSGITNAIAVDAGRDFACVLRSDTTVACWGANGGGQLGNGTGADSATPVAVLNLAGVAALTATENGPDVCATLANGEARCWGAGAAGQIGDGGNANRYVPAKVDF